MADTSLRPYLIRAIYEWCTDAGNTPYVAVKLNEATRVPLAYSKNGEIVLNLSHSATRNLTINNELIQFSARFGGISHEISVPIDAVSGIFARETGKGMFFEVGSPESPAPAVGSFAAGVEPVAAERPPEKPSPKKPRFTVVK